MGNVLLDDYKKDDPLQSFEKWLQQNPQLTGKQVLAQNKLFLTSRFSYNSKQVLLKVYFKRDNAPISDVIKNFEIISTLINQQKCTNLLPLSILNAKEVSQRKEVNLIIATRQFLSMTLEDKLQSRPYLTTEEKSTYFGLQILEWIIFQMIMALQVVHTHLKIYHGNVRTSNFLVTSYDYLMLTDFANYKPTYILEDTQQGLAEFRLFYASSLDKCNLSPQKLQGRSQSASKINKPEYLFNLYQENLNYQRESAKSSFMGNNISNRQKESPQKNDGQKNVVFLQHMNNLKQMDLFSLGLCILQVLNDGKSAFSYESLLNLKKGKFSLQQLIQNTMNTQTFQQEGNQDTHANDLKEIKDMVFELLLKKNDNTQSLLERFPKIMKDEIFVLLWHCLSSFSKISFQLADHRVYLFQSIIEFIQKQIKCSDYKFVMKRAKCLQNFAALKIFAQLIKKKLILASEIDSHTLLGQILSSIEKKQNEASLVESDEDIQLPRNNKRQSFFINESKKKRISKRMSFAGQFKAPKNKKILCPPQADQFLEKLVEQRNFDMKFSKLNLQQRKKTKLQMYLQKIKAEQHLRQELKSEKSYFYADYELIIKIIFSCIRNCQYVASKMLGVELINILARQSSDKTLLRVILPYLISLSQSTDVNVAKYAFNSLLDLCYYFLDPFETEEDIAYYHMLLDFFINTIKGSNIRIYMFNRFEEIYNICEWLEVVYLRIHEKFLEESRMLQQSQYRHSVILQPPRFAQQDKPLTGDQSSSRSALNFYKLVDQLKVSYGTFSPRQIHELMENIPIAILPQMFEFYISFLNTQKIMGLKCSLFIAQNATKEFQMQRYIIDVFDNCMESGLSEMGVALCYSIKYFTIRKNVNLDIVHKITPHIINPHRWVRQEAIQYLRMCLEQFPPAKIFFLFRDVIDAPFPLTVQNLSEDVLLPEPLREIDVNFKERKFTNRISRKIGLTEKKFVQYLKVIKVSKDNSLIKELIDLWQTQTRRFRMTQSVQNPAIPKFQVNTFISSMRKTIQQLYENNFFFYGFALSLKYNPAQKQQGLNNIFQSLKKFSKFNLDTTVVSQEQKQFFEVLFATINSNFQKLVNKMNQEITPDKLKLSLCINLIAQQEYMLHQLRVKPTILLGVSSLKTTSDRNFKPRGIQVSEIYENKEAISNLVKVGDYFFVAGCHDGTMRIYDTRSIEMNIITEAEAVYELKPQASEQKVKINSLTCLQNTYTVVVGTNKGQIKGIQIQRMPSSKVDSSRYIRTQNQLELFKYNVGGDIEKITAPKSQRFNECIAYVTSECVLGVQDIRCKDLSMRCNLGKERGYCLSLSSNDFFCLLVGTVDGYLLTYDIRFNILSSALQLYKENQSLPITNIIKVRQQNKFCITYPSLNYEFAQFSSLDSSQIRIEPTRLYSGTSFSNNSSANNKQEDNIPGVPYFENRTNDEVFKLCNNNLEKHIYYSELSNFDTNYKILDYVSEPLTLKESRIREMWANGCRHRYNQVLSIYNRKCAPFVEYFNGGILTNFNPNPDTLMPRSDSQLQPKELSFLVDKKQPVNQTNSWDIDREMTTRTNKIKISQFDEVQNKDYLTHCAVVNGFVAVANKNSRIKIYK